MSNTNRPFFATIGIVISWLSPLAVFFLFLGVPPVRDLLTAFASVVAIYSTVQLYRWGNYNKTAKSLPNKPITQHHAPTFTDTRTRIRQFLDTLTDHELDELQSQLQVRLNARIYEEKNITEG